MSPQGAQPAELMDVALSGHRAGTRKGWADVLATIPLFSGLNHRHLRRVADKATMKRYAPFTQIVRAGDKGDAFFVILDGVAAVRRPGKRAIKLRAGDFFGELALLDNSPRTASVEAETEVFAMRLGSASFKKILESEPKVSLAMLQTLASRLRATDSAAAVQ